MPNRLSTKLRNREKEHDHGIEEWKLGVERAMLYVSSNATFQVYMFGFYITLMGLVLGVAPNLNSYLIQVFVPLSSTAFLVISALYAKFYFIQTAFIDIYGRRYNAIIKCEEDFAERLANENAEKCFFDYWPRVIFSLRTRPYNVYWFFYISVPIGLAYISDNTAEQSPVYPVHAILLFAFLNTLLLAHLLKEGIQALDAMK